MITTPVFLTSLSLLNVNPWIGTGGTIYASGMTFPGATTPFGFVRLSPDTQFGKPLKFINPLKVATAGYYYDHGRLSGFSHTRMEGAGLKEGGAFRVFAHTHQVSKKVYEKGIRFKHENETASPGFYSLLLPKLGIKTELTTTPHCGVHRYSSKGSLALRIDSASSISSKKINESSITAQEKVVTGHVLYKGDFSNRYGGLPLYFYAELNQVPDSTKTESTAVWLNWKNKISEPIELKLCVSAVSSKNAKQNFIDEVEGRSFQEILSQAQKLWENWLGRIEIKSKSKAVLTKFYSSLYRTAIMPTTFQDTNGEYLGFDRQIKHAEGFTYLTDLSLWDTFRTTHPLYTLIAPEIQRSVLLSLTEMAKLNENKFPLWPAGCADGGSMFGYPAHFLFAEAWAKGIRDFDADSVLEMMAAQALNPDLICNQYDYCPVKKIKSPVSQTLERAWANGVTAPFALSLGKTELAQKFTERADDYKNIWDNKRRFFAPKNIEGKFLSYHPRLISFIDFLKLNHDAYSEGGPHQWRYSAPHQSQELIKLFGGPTKFINQLDNFLWKGSRKKRSAIIPSSFYWHGNQHDLHTIYLFNEAGAPELTQEWSRWALNTRYGTGPNGLDGNDDGGTLSAWYVFSALGLYPQVGTAKYWLGSPIVDEATLDLGNGKTLKIIAQNNSNNHEYVQSVTLNGKKVCKPELTHSELADSVLVFKMGYHPAKKGGYHCIEP